MPRYTDRWGLSILGSGESLQSDGFKFTDADRRLIDRLLTYATEQHHHTGTTGEDHTPDAGLNLTLYTTGGNIPSGARYYYRHTIIDDLGNESLPSPPQYIDTPPTVANPGAPALNYVAGSGSLQPGGYSYVLSAYKGASTQETKAINSAFITVPGGNVANEVSLTLPARPLGADGYNVYRKSPSGMHYLWITDIAAPTPLQVWVDDGSITGDCDRSLPPINRTGGTNAIVVSYPGATPYIPDGWSWRVYRSADPTNWGRSHLKDLTPIGATPTTPVQFIDAGLAPTVGGPPAKAQVINAPPKIDLTDAAEVQGSLPPGLLVAPQMITFTRTGPVELVEGTFTWVCDYDQADIIYCRAYLGAGYTPANDAVIVDVNALRPSQGSTTWESIYTGPTRPRIAVGENLGDPATPAIRHLELGDALSVDVDQTGGGATPTDFNLTVNVLLYVKAGSETTSYPWPA